VKSSSASPAEPFDVVRLLQCLEIDPISPEKFTAALPFSLNDTTVGIENELQTSVAGSADHADLPLIIRESKLFPAVPTVVPNIPFFHHSIIPQAN
jgi:hypothetical protein